MPNHSSTAKQLRKKLRPINFWLEVVAVTQRLLIEVSRRKFSLLCWAVFPVALLVINGMVLAEQTKLSLAETFARSAPPCLVGAALFFSCVGGSVATLVAEREQGTLKRLFVSPLNGTSYFLGIFLAHSVIGVGQTLLVCTVATSVGAEFKGSLGLGWAIVFLSMISYVGIGFCLGTQLAQRTEDVNALVTALGVPSLLLGGAFIPINFFPASLRQIAKFNPIYHMIVSLSQVVSEGAGLFEIESHFGFLVGFAGLMVGCGWLSYRQMLSNERRL